jgi:hypothetical protein
MNGRGDPLNFVAFQEFLPNEQKETGRCIWCGEIAPVNRAHIISKKLTKQAKNAPTLRFRICQACNSLCGNLEQWILRKTPLSLVRIMLYAGTNAGRHSDFPSYFYSEALGDWVVFQLDPASHSYRIGTQLILSNEKQATLLTEEPEERHKAVLEIIQNSARRESALKNVRPSLPSDFTPRLLLLDSQEVIAIAGTEVGAQQALQSALLLEQMPEARARQCLNDSEREHHHFQWSRKNWARFCAKTALETLCLFEGGEVCLRQEFDHVRDFVRNGILSKGKEIVFEQTGPQDNSAISVPVYVDLTAGQTAPEYSACILPHTDPGCHIVLLYEIQGWVLASIVFGGFPPSVLVLAGPDAHLRDVYQMIYDYEESEFHFLRLAYNEREPVIPFPIPGDRFAALANTYRLRKA